MINLNQQDFDLIASRTSIQIYPTWLLMLHAFFHDIFCHFFLKAIFSIAYFRIYWTFICTLYLPIVVILHTQKQQYSLKEDFKNNSPIADSDPHGLYPIVYKINQITIIPHIKYNIAYPLLVLKICFLLLKRTPSFV